MDLEPLREQYLPLTMAWRNVDGVRIWFKSSQVVTPEQHQRWYAAYAQKSDDYMFLIRDRASGAMVGQLGLYHVNHEQREAELGRLITAPGHEGKGLMKKACSCLLDFAHSVFGLKRIRLEVLSSNERAIRLYEKLGFREIGHEGTLLAMAYQRSSATPADTLKAAGATWVLTGMNTGSVSGLGDTFAGMSNLSDTDGGTLVATAGTWTFSEPATGSISNLSGTFAGMRTIIITGPGENK